MTLDEFKASIDIEKLKKIDLKEWREDNTLIGSISPLPLCHKIDAITICDSIPCEDCPLYTKLATIQFLKDADTHH